MFESYTYEKLLEEVLNNATILTHVRGAFFMMQFPESLLKSQNTIPILN